jgi:hypothetical protein
MIEKNSCLGILGEGGWLKDKNREDRQFYDGSDQEKKRAESNERQRKFKNCL